MSREKQIRLTRRKGNMVYLHSDVIPSECSKQRFCKKITCVHAGKKDRCPYLVLLYRLAELEDKIESGELVENAGYRKQSEGEWRPYKTPLDARQTGWICSNCSSVIYDLSNGDTDFCPNCGAMMKGGD